NHRDRRHSDDARGALRIRPEGARAIAPPSLRANGSRERAPDDRLREAIQNCIREEGLDCFVATAPRNDDVEISRKNKIIFCRRHDGTAVPRAYLLPITPTAEQRHGTTSTQTRRVHAPCQPAHRRVALSRRLAGCEFQFPASEADDPKA